MKKKINRILNERFKTYVEKQDGKFCVFFEELNSPNLSMVWFEKAKNSFSTKPIGLKEYAIVDSDTILLVNYINELMKLNENDLPTVRKVIMDFSHDKIKQHFG